MTLEEAIKRNEAIRGFMKEEYEAQDRRAVQLGIEALKAILHSRKIFPDVEVDFLPGETRD